MKKVISILIACILAISSVITGFAVYADEKNESKGINNFIDGVVELTQEYDKGKEFVAPEENETAQIQPFSAQNSEEVTDNNEPEYTLQDFQTARLIVRADGKFDEFGAKEHVSGFEDFHILQYESPEAAMSAYSELQLEKNILNVAPDEIVSALKEEQKENSKVKTYDSNYLCEWSHKRTQNDRLLDYIEKNNISLETVYVAVIDDGLHYDHEFFKDRYKNTGFNSSVDGNKDDEYGSPDGHGTGVCSVIVDNTPSYVQVKCYKVLNDDGFASVSQICLGFIKAIEQGDDIISTSLSYDDNSELTATCVKDAYEKDIPIFASAGNDGYPNYDCVPANIPKCISVSATDKDNATTIWATQSDSVDLSAPGEDIDVATLTEGYDKWTGTSFSTPCVASLGSILKSQNPDITVDELEKILKSSALNVKRHNDTESTYEYDYHTDLDGVGMVQFSSAFGLPELTAPEFSLEDKTYLDTQMCSIKCDDENATVLYTTDGTYPALENATEYKEPFEVTNRTRIRAVAYYQDGGYYSREVEITPRIQYTDSDDAFTITSDGIITKYNGNITDLYVPNTINGITVIGFERGAFDNSTLKGLTLPKTIKSIPLNAFYKNKSLEFIRGEGITNIAGSAFLQSHLKYAEFPNVKEIDDSAFKNTTHFCYGIFSNVETIGFQVFRNSSILLFGAPKLKIVGRASFDSCIRLENIYIPKCIEFISKRTLNGEFYNNKSLMLIEMPLIQNLLDNALERTNIKETDFMFLKTMGKGALWNCGALIYVNMPLLDVVPNKAFGGDIQFRGNKARIYFLDSVTTIGVDAFGTFPTSRLELSHLETAESLPQTEECIISMPSTFRECTEDTNGRNYKVYGTKGTYAEQWANENGHEFIEISQDTAVLTPLPEKYTDADGVLTADVIGFNRTYQWYANDTNDNTTGTPIPNATGKEFNPADYPAKYYYCVVTSTDVGYDPIEIRTNVTENTTYQSADYTEYNKAVEQAKALNRDNYVDLSKLDEALSIDVSNLSVKDQALVDAQTDAIINAINSLVYKPADYTEYNKAVEQAKSLNRDDYVDFSKVDEALAVDVSGKNITEQDIVDKQTKAILEAIDSLTEKEKPTEPPVTEPEEPTEPTEPDTSVDADTPSIPNTGTNESISCAAASLLLLSLCAYFISRKKKNQE